MESKINGFPHGNVVTKSKCNAATIFIHHRFSNKIMGYHPNMWPTMLLTKWLATWRLLWAAVVPATGRGCDDMDDYRPGAVGKENGVIMIATVTTLTEKRRHLIETHGEFLVGLAAI